MLSGLDAYRCAGRTSSCCSVHAAADVPRTTHTLNCTPWPGTGAVHTAAMDCCKNQHGISTREYALAGLENISHMPPATGPDKQPTNVVRVSNALKHK